LLPETHNTLMDTKTNQWDQSYQRRENFIFFPKEEIVKFLNRFVRKRTGIKEYRDILDFSRPVKGLDFGCGIGRQTLLMTEFGIDAYGLDISGYAVQMAKELAQALGYPHMVSRFNTIDGLAIPYEDRFFDITLCEAVLDSMPFPQARILLAEIQRVTRKLAFISLVSGDNSQYYREFAGEETVATPHEQGTIQSYYNWEKIQRLLAGTAWQITWSRLISEESLQTRCRIARYYLVLSREEQK